MLNPNQIGPSAVSVAEKRRHEKKKKEKKKIESVESPEYFCDLFPCHLYPHFIFHNKLVEISFILFISSSVSRLELQANKGAERIKKPHLKEVGWMCSQQKEVVGK